MNKRDALRLKKGDRIAWGNSARSAVVDQYGRWRYGDVLHVTPNGGIKVQPIGTIEGDHLHPWKHPGKPEWVPYHHVHQGIKL